MSECGNTSGFGLQPQTSHTTSDNEMVLMLRPAEDAHIAMPLTITCGKIQIQTSSEPTIFDPSGQTIMLIRLLLAIEREQRPDLTIDALIDEIAENQEYRQLTLRQSRGMASEVYDTDIPCMFPNPSNGEYRRSRFRFRGYCHY